MIIRSEDLMRSVAVIVALTFLTQPPARELVGKVDLAPAKLLRCNRRVTAMRVSEDKHVFVDHLVATMIDKLAEAVVGWALTRKAWPLHNVHLDKTSLGTIYTHKDRGFSHSKPLGVFRHSFLVSQTLVPGSAARTKAHRATARRICTASVVAAAHAKSSETATAAVSRPQNGVVTEKAGGWLTDFVVFPAEDAVGQRTVLVYIPGNPGIIDGSVEFLRRIHKKCNGSVEVVGIGHPGHSLSTLTDKPLSLQEQIAHKLAFLERRYFKNTKKNSSSLSLVLVGHSIGAYISLKIAESLTSDQFHSLRIFGLNAVILRQADTLAGQSLSKILDNALARATFATIAGAVSWLPLPARRFFARSLVDTPRQARTLKLFFQNQGPLRPIWRDPCVEATVQATLYGLSRKCVGSCLFMATTQYEQVRELDPLEHAFKSLGGRVRLVFCSKDKWTPREFIDEVQKRFPECKCDTIEDDKLGHLFQFKDYGTDTMVEWLASQLNDS